jgi:hypothetical protein
MKDLSKKKYFRIFDTMRIRKEIKEGRDIIKINMKHLYFFHPYFNIETNKHYYATVNFLGANINDIERILDIEITLKYVSKNKYKITDYNIPTTSKNKLPYKLRKDIIINELDYNEIMDIDDIEYCLYEIRDKFKIEIIYY